MKSIYAIVSLEDGPSYVVDFDEDETSDEAWRKSVTAACHAMFDEMSELASLGYLICRVSFPSEGSERSWYIYFPRLRTIPLLAVEDEDVQRYRDGYDGVPGKPVAVVYEYDPDSLYQQVLLADVQAKETVEERKKKAFLKGGRQ